MINSSSTTIQHNFSIFIANNNEIECLLLKAQLENRSDDITLARDGNQALSLLRQSQYQLILLDLQLSHFNGLELLDQIKQADCINNNTPVVAITAHTQSQRRKKLIEAGFDACLIKPVLLDQLDEILGIWLPTELEHSIKCKKNHELDIVFIKQMLEKTSQNKELALVLFNKLFKELPVQITLIEQALTHSDLTLAKEITHKLHGSIRFCGFINLQKAANQLEAGISKNDSQNTLTSFLKLKQQVDHFMSIKDLILQNL